VTVALVTGANKGVGLAVARTLAQQGVKTWLGARDEDRGRAAETALRAQGLDVEYLPLDVSDLASIAAAAARVAASTDALDILVNNAGVMVELETTYPTPQPPSEVSLEKLRKQYETNVLGPIAMIQGLLPLLRRSAAGRIVNVAARLGSFDYKTDPDRQPEPLNLIGYCTSKAALNMVTVVFARELLGTPIKINAVSPGIIATDISGPRAGDLAGRPGFGTPDQGAQPIVKYATLPEDGPSGGFFGPDGVIPW
jgi:NAD(P)-dependent dehydrogenase (short-subunit alcohol dehydrogenase family)